VRHNEELLNEKLAQVLPWAIDDYESPHCKAFLLFQGRFDRCELPIVDYYTDTKSVLDQSIRICQAMLDVAGDKGYFGTCFNIVRALQMVIQARWHTAIQFQDTITIHQDDDDIVLHECFKSASPFLCIPNVVDNKHVKMLKKITNKSRAYLMSHDNNEIIYSQQEGIIGCGSNLGINDDLRVLAQTSMMIYSNGSTNDNKKGDEFIIDGSTKNQQELLQVKIVLNQIPKPIYKNVIKYISHLPVVNMKTRIKEAKSHYLSLDQEYTLEISLRNLNTKSASTTRSYKWPRSIPLQWILILYCKNTNELLALKRIKYFHKSLKTSLSFYTPDEEELCGGNNDLSSSSSSHKHGELSFKLFVLSDCIMGIDCCKTFQYQYQT